MPATARFSTFYFLYFALLGAVMPFLGLYLHRELGLAPAAIGQLMMATLAARLLAPAFWGATGDRSGRHLDCLRAGCLMLVLVWTVFAQVRAFPTLVLVLLAYSFFQGAILAPFEALTLQYLGPHRERYGSLRRWGSLGFIAAGLGLGQLFTVLPLAWLPPVLAALALLLFAGSLAVPAVRLAAPVTLAPPLAGVLGDRRVQAFLGAGFLMQLTQAPYFAFYSVYLSGQGYGNGSIGGLWALAVAAEMIAFTQSHHLLRRFGPRRVLQAALLLAALRSAVIGLLPHSLAALAAMQLLQGLVFAAFHCACLQMLQRHFGPGLQGRGQALYGMLWGVAGALGAGLAGSLWGVAGPGAVFLLAALPCLLAWAWLARGRTVRATRALPRTATAGAAAARLTRGPGPSLPT